jgi:hypothetical protein
MVRLFGRHNNTTGSNGRNHYSRSGSNDTNDNNQHRNNNNNNKKLRLSPSAALDTNHLDDDDDNDGVTPSTARRHRQHAAIRSQLSSPMYEYALDEYALAVAPGTSNDDGRSAIVTTTRTSTIGAVPLLPAPSKLRGVRKSNSYESAVSMPGVEDTNGIDPCENDVEHGITSRRSSHAPAQFSSHSTTLPQDQIPLQPQQQSHLHQYPHLTATISSSSSSVTESAFLSTAATRNSSEPRNDLRSSTETHRHNNGTNMYDSSSSNIRSAFEKDMPDVTYEEVYGPAYIGGTIKYLYPTGYQSMRPRSCPWKLSIMVCLLFTWLSIFIVGHCSDQADESAAAAAANADGVITDDALVIEIRWCGSRLLYIMWATSMMVTGLSAAYCSVIGYIKVRDFAVANSRSQPPGVTEGKSDYYVRIRDHTSSVDFTHSGSGIIHRNSHNTTSEGGATSSISYFQPTIYQSDGTPQFWGSHIYRPTQAAVAVTSR